ncbi:excisionase family DNA binding protein [Chitinophaga sp. W2I13]|uniref:helix-turn-helix domain-containing protein n=1 Tax=Chitinophaga sp. W2I13 TaxID=3373923 RepID=UPI003D262B6F
MSENVRNENVMAPMLFPFDPDQFWQRVRLIIREELAVKEKSDSPKHVYETSGLLYKPVYKIAEVCELFQVTRQTVYDWIRVGKLKRYKVRSRVFFLKDEIWKVFQQEDKTLDNYGTMK